MQVGIEHTEAVPQNEAHKDALRERGNGPDKHFIELHDYDEPKKSQKELIMEIEADALGDGWPGDLAERKLADAIIHFIDKKVEVMQNEEFEKFEQNWLLIYDNWLPATVDRHKAVHLVQERIIEQKTRQEFERIYVITDQFLCEFDHARIRMFDTNDLWN